MQINREMVIAIRIKNNRAWAGHDTTTLMAAITAKLADSEQNKVFITSKLNDVWL